MQNLEEMNPECFNAVFQTVNFKEFDNLFLTSKQWFSKRELFWNNRLKLQLNKSNAVFSVNNAAKTYQEWIRLENYLYTYQILDAYSTKVHCSVLNALHEHFITPNYSPESVINDIVNEMDFESNNPLSDKQINSNKLQIKALYHDKDLRTKFHQRLCNMLNTILYDTSCMKSSQVALYTILDRVHSYESIVDFLITQIKDKTTADSAPLLDAYQTWYKKMASVYPENYFDALLKEAKDEELKPLITQQFEEVLFKFRIIKSMVQFNCRGLLTLLIQTNPNILILPFGNNSLLYQAIKYKKLELVSLLLTQPIDLNNSHCIEFDEQKSFVNNAIGPTPLLFALEHFIYDVPKENDKKMIQIIQLLLEKCVDLNVPGLCRIDMGREDGHEGIEYCLFSPMQYCKHTLAEIELTIHSFLDAELIEKNIFIANMTRYTELLTSILELGDKTSADSNFIQGKCI